MFSIKIYSDDESLLDYLSYEGTKIGENNYEFSSPDRLADVLGRYVYYCVKKETLHKLIPETENRDTEIESFLMFVPHTYEEMWKKRITEAVSIYINNEIEEELYMDGFMTFRMNDVKRKYFHYLNDEYQHFADATEPDESLEALIDFMRSQPFKVDEIVIQTNPNGHILIKEEDVCVYIETEGEQENLVVQSIYSAPRRVRVIDEFDVLRKEFVVVLKQIFGKNLYFERKKESK